MNVTYLNKRQRNNTQLKEHTPRLNWSSEPHQICNDACQSPSHFYLFVTLSLPRHQEYLIGMWQNIWWNDIDPHGLMQFGGDHVSFQNKKKIEIWPQYCCLNKYTYEISWMSEREEDLIKLRVKKWKWKWKTWHNRGLPGGGGGGGGAGGPISLAWMSLSLIQGFAVTVASLAEGGCLLSRFHTGALSLLFESCCCRNLPWQDLITRLLLQGLLLHLIHTTIFSSIYFFTVTRDPSPHVRRQTFRPYVNIRSCSRSY